MSSKTSVITINSPVGDIKGFGPKKQEALSRLGILNLFDVLYHYPRSYEDLRNVKNIADLQDDEKALVKARVLIVQPGKGWGRKRSLRLLAEDSSGRMEIIFFSAGFMMKSFAIGSEYRFFGKVKVENGRVTMFHPGYTAADDPEQTGIVPVYPLAMGLKQKEMRRLSRMALELSRGMPETLPDSVIKSAKLCGIHYAFSNIHYPENEKAYQEARYRLIYEELFDLKTALLLSRDRFGMGRAGTVINSGGAERLIDGLPYPLTGAQQRVLGELLNDMRSPRAMNRLIQGDVGSGKTVIAAAALAEAAFCGLQGAFMAPTEILAVQHFNTLKKLFLPLGINVELLTGSLSAAEKKAAYGRLQSGESLIAVGTHALLSEGVHFKDLALVITDEQHRFGVNQRKILSEKAENPDILIMTATPIPRTLAVVLYADLDISVIDELPPGRMPITTKRYNERTRKDAYKLLLSEIAKGRQAYIVAPFIDDSETIDGYSAEGLFEEFTSKHPDVKAALLHGAMSQSEKDSVMQAFKDGTVSVLISTVVIEVGIDVANATVMLIENSERFGLAQMHQLRGRVGRGSEQSYCLLITDEKNELAVERAETLCKTSDGFEIAEKDLQLRGPGEFFGFRQHGIPQLRLADPARHSKVVAQAEKDAKALIERDPKLALPENKNFSELIRQKFLMENNITL